VEKMVQERVVLLATVRGEADKAALRVFALEGEVVAARHTQDMAKEKFPSLSAQAAAVKQ
jgi:hypothetical protein